MKRRGIEELLAASENVAEGGCGVVGFIASKPVKGIHIRTPCQQMHNRGNGKGGGVALAGIVSADLGIPEDLISTHNLIAIAYMDDAARAAVEAEVSSAYDVAHSVRLEPRCTFQEAGLATKPPDVWIYMCRPNEKALSGFAGGIGKQDSRDAAHDDYVVATSNRLNDTFYASMGEKRALVLSHGYDMLVVKVVGYAEQAAMYYGLDEVHAKAWIGHQRYPTKGVVWHPGGAHPFVGMHEALVHNGDFANYAAVCSYLHEFGIVPRFLTDTEVSVLLLDLYTRVFEYPLEWAIEALAPTVDRDFDQLPDDKKGIYQRLQTSHIHGSPDGPWFFIVIRNPPGEALQLVGITDTSMLRPQVFALHDGDVKIGLIASERQAIDATLASLHEEDPRILPVADKYWVARGGSHTDGGAFVFKSAGRFSAENKFGQTIEIARPAPTAGSGSSVERVLELGLSDPVQGQIEFASAAPGWDQANLRRFLDDASHSPAEEGLAFLTRLADVPGVVSPHRSAWVRWQIDEAIQRLLARDDGWPRFDASDVWTTGPLEGTVVLDASRLAPEGPQGLGPAIVRLRSEGAQHVIVHRLRGQRFAAAGLGPHAEGFRLDLYGTVGDYVASGLDGAHVEIHSSAQDQVGQILKSGELVVHGDVGQAFMYGAKGGNVYVRGNAAGRPLINATGRPRVVINGTCLDYLAEAFMAGDALNGGGFCIVNALTYDEAGQLVELPEPYPGGNLFSLAAGGAIYVRDPARVLTDDQLNGGLLKVLADEDWTLIEPYLRRNEEHFGIPVDRLLTVDGVKRPPNEVYRKVVPAKLRVLARMAHT